MGPINTATTNSSKMIINDLSTLEEWTKSLNTFRSVNTMNSVVFDLSPFSFNENLNLTTRVDYYNSNYGRKTQGCFMTLAILAIFCDFLISLFSETVFEITLNQILINIGIIIFSALTGKLAGLIYSHCCLIKIAQRIKQRVARVYAMKHMI